MCAEADMPTSVAGQHNAVVVAVVVVELGNKDLQREADNSVDNREREQPNKRHV